MGQNEFSLSQAPHMENLFESLNLVDPVDACCSIYDRQISSDDTVFPHIKEKCKQLQQGSIKALQQQIKDQEGILFVFRITYKCNKLKNTKCL